MRRTCQLQSLNLGFVVIKMLPSTNNNTSALLSMISWQKEEVGRFRILKASQPRQFGFIQSLDPQ